MASATTPSFSAIGSFDVVIVDLSNTVAFVLADVPEYATDVLSLAGGAVHVCSFVADDILGRFAQDVRDMSKRIGREQRVFVDQDLGSGTLLDCDVAQRNYLINVLRLQTGAPLRVFNGRDGEWRATLLVESRKLCRLEVVEQVQHQTAGPDITLMFAPLKRARLDYLVQKATELGVRAVHPVQTAFTQSERVNVERMRSNVIEAAEQCGVLRVPEVMEPQKLGSVLDHWDAEARLVFCDEDAAVGNPIEALQLLSTPVAVLIGPEGGFSQEERDRLRRMETTTSVSLGPRIMRADTAAVAVLALLNAVIGDWQ